MLYVATETLDHDVDAVCLALFYHVIGNRGEINGVKFEIS